MDGISLKPNLTTNQLDIRIDRNLFMQWHRGNEPVKNRNRAVINDDYKLIRNCETDQDELYNITKDPYEKNDLYSQEPERVKEMINAYEDWFRDVSTTREDNFSPPPLHIGSPYQKKCELTRQDWRIVNNIDGWGEESLGHWEIDVLSSSPYQLEIYFIKPSECNKTLYLEIGEQTYMKSILQNQKSIVLNHVQIESGFTTIKAWAADKTGTISPALQVTVQAQIDL
jgi:arylsulfatase/arylsulfatase A